MLFLQWVPWIATLLQRSRCLSLMELSCSMTTTQKKWFQWIVVYSPFPSAVLAPSIAIRWSLPGFNKLTALGSPIMDAKWMGKSLSCSRTRHTEAQWGTLLDAWTYWYELFIKQFAWRRASMKGCFHWSFLFRYLRKGVTGNSFFIALIRRPLQHCLMQDYSLETSRDFYTTKTIATYNLHIATIDYSLIDVTRNLDHPPRA